jgi:hypothetical protein
MLEKLACLRRVRAIFPVESSLPAMGDNKSKIPHFQTKITRLFQGCFKVPIERVTVTEYNYVNFIEFPDL